LNENTKKNENEGELHVIYLRNYSKAIFLFPLFFTSIILWIIEALYALPGSSITGLGFIWTLVFFINLLTISFDFSSMKLFIIALIIVVIILLVVFLVLPASLAMIMGEVQTFEFNIGMTAEFYMVMSFILTVVLAAVLIGVRFDYWRLEQNEIYHRSGIFVKTERYSTQGIRISKKIPDLIEFLLLRAGSITLIFGDSDVVHLSTILNINQISNKIDKLLSELNVDVELPDDIKKLTSK
jgi:hypothetical protein